MGFFSSIWEWLKGAARAFWNAIKRLVAAIVNFFTHVVSYFRNLRLQKNRHKPFVADLSKLKAEINDAPVKNCGIFEGVYDEVTDDIIHTQLVESDTLDAKTQEMLGNDKLVVLA